MESARIMNETVSCSNNLDGYDLKNTKNEASFPLIYELKPPVLNSFYRVLDIPIKYIEPIVLDTSLPHIPVYTHLKTYDLKPIVRPSTPPILSELRLNCFTYSSRNSEESSESFKGAPSTERTSTVTSSIAMKARENEHISKIE